MDDKGQIFLLLMWVVTLLSLIAALWLFKDVRHVSMEATPEAPYVIPRESARANTGAPRLVAPPPPF